MVRVAPQPQPPNTATVVAAPLHGRVTHAAAAWPVIAPPRPGMHAGALGPPLPQAPRNNVRREGGVECVDHVAWGRQFVVVVVCGCVRALFAHARMLLFSV